MTADQFLARLEALLRSPDGSGGDVLAMPVRVATQRHHPGLAQNRTTATAPFADRSFSGVTASQGLQIIPGAYYDTMLVSVVTLTSDAALTEPVFVSFGTSQTTEGLFSTGSIPAFKTSFPPHWAIDTATVTPEAISIRIETPLTDAPFIVWFGDDPAPDATKMVVTVTLLNVRHA